MSGSAKVQWSSRLMFIMAAAGAAGFMDHVTSNILLPLGGFLIAIFVGWVMPKFDTAEELQLHGNQWIYRGWRICMRYIAPVAIIIVFLNAIGVVGNQ